MEFTGFRIKGFDMPFTQSAKIEEEGFNKELLKKQVEQIRKKGLTLEWEKSEIERLYRTEYNRLRSKGFDTAECYKEWQNNILLAEILHTLNEEEIFAMFKSMPYYPIDGGELEDNHSKKCYYLLVDNKTTRTRDLLGTTMCLEDGEDVVIHIHKRSIDDFQQFCSERSVNIYEYGKPIKKLFKQYVKEQDNKVL